MSGGGFRLGSGSDSLNHLFNGALRQLALVLRQPEAAAFDGDEALATCSPKEPGDSNFNWPQTQLPVPSRDIADGYLVRLASAPLCRRDVPGIADNCTELPLMESGIGERTPMSVDQRQNSGSRSKPPDLILKSSGRMPFASISNSTWYCSKSSVCKVFRAYVLNT